MTYLRLQRGNNVVRTNTSFERESVKPDSLLVRATRVNTRQQSPYVLRASERESYPPCSNPVQHTYLTKLDLDDVRSVLILWVFEKIPFSFTLENLMHFLRTTYRT